MGKDHSGGDSGSPVDPRVARRRQDPIGRRLRQMYDEVVSENVPDEFMSFLEQADERQTDGQANGTDHETPAPKQRPVKTEP
jgi:Anti-sigma factor NepR